MAGIEAWGRHTKNDTSNALAASGTCRLRYKDKGIKECEAEKQRVLNGRPTARKKRTPGSEVTTNEIEAMTDAPYCAHLLFEALEDTLLQGLVAEVRLVPVIADGRGATGRTDRNAVMMDGTNATTLVTRGTPFVPPANTTSQSLRAVKYLAWDAAAGKTKGPLPRAQSAIKIHRAGKEEDGAEKKNRYCRARQHIEYMIDRPKTIPNPQTTTSKHGVRSRETSSKPRHASLFRASSSNAKARPFRGSDTKP